MVVFGDQSSSRTSMTPTFNSRSTGMRDANTSRHQSRTGDESQPDVAVFVQDLLEQMQTRFSDMEKSLDAKMETMGEGLDELDLAIGQLMEQAGLESPDAAATKKQSSKHEINEFPSTHSRGLMMEQSLDSRPSHVL